MLNQIGIHSEIKELFNDIKFNDLISFDKSISENSNRYCTSVQLTCDDFSIIKEHIKKDIVQTISRKSIMYLIDNSRKEYIDLTKYNNDIELDRLSTDELIKYIIDSGYKKCILNGMLAVCIQDSSLFNFTKVKSTLNSADIYNIGSIYGTEFYVDPYMKYNDNTIILLNEIRMNIAFIDVELSNEATFHPRIKIDFNSFYYDSDYLVCSVLEKKGSPTYLKYISDLRNQKIDDILND